MNFGVDSRVLGPRTALPVADDANQGDAAVDFTHNGAT